MLLVIFGAGASFDSVPHIPADADAVRQISAVGSRFSFNYFRPPLANQLFEDRELFRKVIDKFPRCKALIPRLRGNTLIEQQLAKFEEQSKTFPERHCQLAAIRYYIQHVLWELQGKWRELHGGVTNYVTFLDEIERWRIESRERVIFVTFNYDTMLEDAIEQVFQRTITDFAGYISHDYYKVIKLHGSINWGFEVLEPSAVQDPLEIIKSAHNLKLAKDYRRVVGLPSVLEGNTVGFPALAIPVEKKDEFSCPMQHLTVLANAIPEVKKIVAIGWRAMEQDFLRMLTAKLTGLKGDVDVMVVSGTTSGAKETLKNLGFHNSSKSKRSLVDSGFTGLINNIGLLEVFLR